MTTRRQSSRPLPPLNALRAFEVAARHSNFSVAATELNISPGAVSRHISLLEARLGNKLFMRHPRGVQLTREGTAYFKVVSGAFNSIRHGTDEYDAARQGRSALSVWVYPTFAHEWLFARLREFRAQDPAIDFRIKTSVRPLDLYTGEVDVAIIVQPANTSRLHCAPLYYERFTPVCSPEIARTISSPKDFSVFERNDVLVTPTHLSTWEKWIEVVDGPALDTARAQVFDSSSLAYKAARHSLGIALGERTVIQDALNTGELVAPYTTDYVFPSPLSFITLKDRNSAPQIRALYDWIEGYLGKASEPHI